MVSIPDWSKLGRLGEVPQDQTTPSSKYYKQQAEEYIKQAKEHGYFAHASRSFIEREFLPDEETEKKKSFLAEYNAKHRDLSGLRLVKLVGAHLRTVGDIGLCNQLRICILSNNFITRIEALAPCRQLIKLDLHGNQISTLPTSTFWAGMYQLKILHLHDNPIGKIDNLHHLAGCCQLAALTMYDTPLSLKRNYRHHVVNSVWSLKALDNIVISDEEIIEDAEFGGRFGALHPAFAVALCPPSSKSADYEEELQTTFQVLREINRILAHHSAVLLIQRFIRGFLTRRRFGVLRGARLCDSDAEEGAAVTIQRKFRDYKSLPTPKSVDIPPPPSSPATDKRAPGGIIDALKLDYDTYLKHRRPGSTGFSEASISSRQSRQMLEPEPPAAQVVEDYPSVPANSAKSDPDGAPLPHRKNIFVNLAKLQAGTLYNLQDEAVTMEMMLRPSDPTMATREEISSRSRPDPFKVRKKKPQPERKRKVIKSVKQFFGPVVENVPSPEPVDSPRREDEEIPRISFRLKGVQHKIRFYDPIASMIISRREAGHEIRAAEDHHHRHQELQQQHVTTKPTKSVPSSQTSNADQRMFARVQGTMGLSCLHAIQQAYKDREKAEKQAAKLDYVMGMRENREAAKDRIQRFHETKRAKSLKTREKDQKLLLEMLERREVLRLKHLNKTQDKRSQSSHHSKQRQGELTFMSEFSTQKTSVSNALLRHDRQARNEDLSLKRSETVQTMKEMDSEQKALVKKYMEHRQVMRQTETAMARAALDTRMLQDANERLMEARTRLAQQKARSAQVETFYPLPSVSTHSLPPMNDDRESLAPSTPGVKGLDRWNTSVMMARGRVGQHPTFVA